MTDTATTAISGDERLAYRSVFQRMFVRPEVGAMIGAVAVWTFFWAVADVFGTAGQTFGWLDNAAILGIVAVAVSMLMIGGEFDLSSGAMTGAMGMLIIYMVKTTGDLGGMGLPLIVAIPVTLVVALGIGFVNGWMVERTGQPSFIITLATFFVLIGLKLGLSKRFVGQIQMGDSRDAKDFDLFQPIFAAEWQRNDFQFELRDFFYTVFIAVGVVCIVVAIYELWFQRREKTNSAGLVQFVGGCALGTGGGIALHLTDGRVANGVIAAVIAVAVFVGLSGLATWRYEPVSDRGTVTLSDQMKRRLGLGFGLILVGCIAAIVIDASDESDIIFPFTVQGMRVILFALFVGSGIALLAMASQAALSVNPSTKFVATSSMALGTGVIAALVFIESESQKFRGALFSVLIMGAALLFTWAFVSSRFVERRRPEPTVDRFGTRLMGGGLALAVLGVALRLLFTVQAEIDAEISPAKTSIRVFWFFLFTAVMMLVLARTRFGSWTYAVGGNKEAARQVGVPAARTKTRLFMLVSFAAWLVGLLIAFRINSIQANVGDGNEFEYIIAAVVGGTLLTGGYGTVFGGAVGACIMAMPLIGISNARWNTDWRFLLLGVILLTAVVANRSIRVKAEGIRR